MKIITLCGYLKFQKEMMTIAEKMSLEGYCILTPVYPVSDNIERTEEQEDEEEILNLISHCSIISYIKINLIYGDIL